MRLARLAQGQEQEHSIGSKHNTSSLVSRAPWFLTGTLATRKVAPRMNSMTPRGINLRRVQPFLGRANASRLLWYARRLDLNAMRIADRDGMARELLKGSTGTQPSISGIPSTLVEAYQRGIQEVPGLVPDTGSLEQLNSPQAVSAIASGAQKYLPRAKLMIAQVEPGDAVAREGIVPLWAVITCVLVMVPLLVSHDERPCGNGRSDPLRCGGFLRC